MAKKSTVNRNKKRIALTLKYANKRTNLKKIIMKSWNECMKTNYL